MLYPPTWTLDPELKGYTEKPHPRGDNSELTTGGSAVSAQLPLGSGSGGVRAGDASQPYPGQEQASHAVLDPAFCRMAELMLQAATTTL